jgi:hypothetical protein
MSLQIFTPAITLGSLAFLLASGASAPAAVDSWIGDVDFLSSPPADARLHQLESSTQMFVWEEFQNVMVAHDLLVDVDGTPAIYDSRGSLSCIVIPTGTPMSSHMIHFDHGVSPPFLSGEVTFDSEIIGVCVSNSMLDATDGPLGSLTTLYDPSWINPARELDWFSPSETEIFEISPDRRRIIFTLCSSNAMDEIRVITSSTTAAASLPTDLNQDGKVGIVDLMEVLDVWGPCDRCHADINGNGKVGVRELLMLFDSWGTYRK